MLYKACDEAKGLPSLARILNRSRKRRLDLSQLQDRFGPLVDRGLVVTEGDRFLALAVPLGEYVPREAVGRRFYETARGMGRRLRGGIAVPLPPGPRGALRLRLEVRPRKSSPYTVTPECFRLIAEGQPVVV